jgi:hypothetical protein
MPDLVPPLAQGLLDELAGALRIVIVNGPRQSGKTTMLGQYQRAHGGSYRTLDNRQDQEAALADPVAFAFDGGVACENGNSLSVVSSLPFSSKISYIRDLVRLQFTNIDYPGRGSRVPSHPASVSWKFDETRMQPADRLRGD